MIWVLFPAFNEAEALPKLLPKVNQALIDHGEPFRLVVVDDGSTDATA
ncbi:MAG: glycosyltransferase, partial [Chloroflexota bacterium]